MTIETAATRSAEWLAARDNYFNHIFSCTNCRPQVTYYCPTGEQVRHKYNQITLRNEHEYFKK